MRVLKTAKYMLVAVAIATCISAPAEAKKKQAKQDQIEELRKAMIALNDQLFVDAHKNGMGIIVTTSLNLDHKYPTQDIAFDNNAMYTSSRTGALITDQTSTSIWKENAAGSTFKVGNDMDSENEDLSRSFYNFVAGGTRYMVYIVAPGTYSIAGASYDLPRSLAPKASAARGTGRPSRIGQVVFKETKFSEFEKGQEWRDAKYGTEAVQSNYCTMVIAGSNQCVSWSTYAEHVTTQTSAAGYRDTLKKIEVDGLSVEATLAAPFASFSVAPGEILLVDGLFADNPAASFIEKGCERLSSEQVNCALTGFDLTRIPAFVADMDKAGAESRGYPKLAQLLKQIQYRELKMTAKPDKQKPGGREVYFIEVGK